jgi:hypothetical protein
MARLVAADGLTMVRHQAKKSCARKAPATKPAYHFVRMESSAGSIHGLLDHFKSTSAILAGNSIAGNLN